MVIPFQWDDTIGFYLSDVAAVQQNVSGVDKWGVIDKSGNAVSPPVWDGGGGGGGEEGPGILGDVARTEAGGLGFDLPSGAVLDIEYSTDLQNWTVVASGVTGSHVETDAERIAAPGGYYRGVARP